MDSEFLSAFRAALETGDFEALAGLYAADARFEGYLPGGLREARGPGEIVGMLADELGRSATIAAWNPIRATTVDLEVARGEPPERKRQIHKVLLADGLIARHWAYPVMLDSISMGDSGARHRRVERADGTIVYEKQISPSHDWIMRATHDLGREAILWRDGPLRDVPPSIDYPIVSAEPLDDGWLITTRDVGSDLLPDEPTMGDWRLVIERLTELHERFAGRAPQGLCSIEDRLALFSQAMTVTERAGSDRYPKILQQGWRESPRLLPADLAGPLLSLASDPAPLVRALSHGRLTLIHGDANQTNLGLRDGRLVALDWALAAKAPAELEFTWLLSAVGDLRDEVLEAVVAAQGSSADPSRLRLALLFQAILELPQLAFVVVTGGPGRSEAAAADLEWWFDRAREGLATLDA